MSVHTEPLSLTDERPPRLWWGLFKRFLLGGTIIVLLSASVTATVGLETVRQVATNLARGGGQIKSPALTADQAGKAQTIMIIGSDKRARSKDVFDRTDPAHTDTILLLRMDPHAGQTSILSIPRDLLVSFEGPKGFYPNQKINAAYTYGGATLTLKVVKQALGGIAINHVIDLNFQAFRQVVDAIGCVYVDVDRRYFNENLGTAATNFASINIQPGYQKLCGQPALDYARYRHTDSDFVRVARQQDFIRQVKEQVGVEGLINNYGQITSAVGRAIETDIRGTTDVLRLLKLAAFSLSRPIRQVKFQANPNEIVNKASYVVATPTQIHATVRDFVRGNQHVRLSRRTPAVGRGARVPSVSNPASLAAVGLLAATPAQRTQMRSGLGNVPFRIYLPRAKTGAGILSDVHPYAVRDEHKRLWRGYRVDWQQSSLGGYYGFEGTNWTDPPLFAHARSQRIAGRLYLFVDDGSHIHDIGWRERGALYWVSNTLLEDLSNRQMLALAQSARPMH